jgi:antitoxin (DNA-binding transcriptional repressor) of toxin-antitoxin stability system
LVIPWSSWTGLIEQLQQQLAGAAVCSSKQSGMKEVSISEFKAKCLCILEEVRKPRRPIRVTRFGKPVAEMIPPSPGETTGRRLGSMVGTGKILGDIVGPTGTWDDWEASR